MKTFLSSCIYFISLFSAFTASAHGPADNFCADRPNISQKFQSIRTDAGTTVTLDFGDQEPTVNTTSAVVCTTPESRVSDAILWMPSMGHGSAPTTVSADADHVGCFLVEDMDFIMNGHWQVKVQMDSQGEVVFDVCI